VKDRPHNCEANPAQGSIVNMANNPVGKVGNGVDRFDGLNGSFQRRESIERAAND